MNADSAAKQPSASRKPNWRKKSLLLTGAVVAGLLLCEGIVRVAGLAPRMVRIKPGLPQSPYRLSENPILGYVYKENYRGPDNAFLGVAQVNAHGFQDQERAVKKPSGAKRIIMLGDSVIACGAIPQRLEAMLKPDNVEVLNFGINGYCTRAEVELLKERGLKFAPDLVILVFVHNDYYNFNGDLGFTEQLPPLVQQAFLHSHLFRFASLRWNWFDLRWRMGINEVVGTGIGNHLENVQAMETMKRSPHPARERLREHLLAIGDDNVSDGLRLLKALADQHGFQAVVVIWPTFEGDHILDYETADVGQKQLPPEGEPLRIEQLAAAHGLRYFRLSPFFREDARRVSEQGQAEGKSLQAYFTEDGMHPLDAGNAVAAQALNKIISDHPELLGRARTEATE